MCNLTSFRPGEVHGLPGKLVVSLTSYPKRYPTLDLTLKSLLDQDVKPDLIVLWLTPDEHAALPASVTSLQSPALEIRLYPHDLRSYAKIIPSLEAFPDAYIVTADDDLFYPPHWLGALTRRVTSAGPCIVCHRAHRPTYYPDGALRPYADWVWNTPALPERASLFPTGVGGVLYPPRSLHPDVLDSATFLALAPHADDVWLFFMGHLAGSRYEKVPGDFHLLVWPGSQATSLMEQNVDNNQNDAQIKALEQRFGLVEEIAPGAGYTNAGR